MQKTIQHVDFSVFGNIENACTRTFVAKVQETMTTHAVTLTCPGGLEALLVEECSVFGMRAMTAGRGAVTGDADLEACYRACLWSRFANHVLLRVAALGNVDADGIYGGLLAVEWEKWLQSGQHLLINVSGSTPSIANTQHAVFRAKDAIVDRMRERGLNRPVIDRERPDMVLQLHLDERGSAIYLNLNGASLHERGYRVSGVEAPAKENLAAAVAAWGGMMQKGEAESSPPMVLDPLCGSGTLLIEAAWMCAGIAPGLLRTRWGFQSWKNHDAACWERVRSDALVRREQGLTKPIPSFVGFDADPKAVRAAQANVVAAGLAGRVHVERRPLALLGSGKLLPSKGVLLTNPPYGERLSALDAAPYLYRCLGRKLRHAMPGWRAAVLGARVEHLDEFRIGQHVQHRCHNGPLPCFVRVFEVPGGGEMPWPAFRLRNDVEVAGEGEHLVNRLRKNWKQLKPWVERETIRAFRLYDADLPEFNVAVDVYGDRIHVQEYAAPSSVDPAKAAHRLNVALDAIAIVCGRKRHELSLKVRARQKGGQQYARQADQGELYEVDEYGARLLVNFTDYLDTGIFLDHRPVRRRLQELCRDKHFLNLFCYTGSATVHAALGGARSSVSVDLNPRYLAWAEANLSLNGYSTAQHQLVQSDVGEWLARGGEQFDVIFMDAPTFSNSKRTPNVLDIQRDQEVLVRNAMRHLSRDGLLLFSNNYRRFSLDASIERDFDVRDISASTIPQDFARNQKIHRCWEIRHRG